MALVTATIILKQDTRNEDEKSKAVKLGEEDLSCSLDLIQVIIPLIIDSVKNRLNEVAIASVVDVFRSELADGGI